MRGGETWCWQGQKSPRRGQSSHGRDVSNFGLPDRVAEGGHFGGGRNLFPPTPSKSPKRTRCSPVSKARGAPWRHTADTTARAPTAVLLPLFPEAAPEGREVLTCVEIVQNGAIVDLGGQQARGLGP